MFQKTPKSSLSATVDHLWRPLTAKRIALGLTQLNVAILLKTTECNINAWELNHRAPGVRFTPRIVAFLGYVPYTPGCPFSETLRIWRESWGLNQEQMARFLGIDESTIAYWERGEHQPSAKSLQVIGSKQML